MSPKRRGLGGWLARRPTYQQLALFVGAAGAIGTAVTSFERTYGVLAANFGFARTVEVTDSVQDLKAWQLYSDIRRLKRGIYDIGTPKTDRDRELLHDFTTQLLTVQTEYDRITTKRRR